VKTDWKVNDITDTRCDGFDLIWDCSRGMYRHSFKERREAEIQIHSTITELLRDSLSENRRLIEEEVTALHP
jgi:hypothetical protein